MKPGAVRGATAHDVPTIAEALADAFHDDPAMRWLVPDRPGRLARWFAVEARRHLTHDSVLVDDQGRGASLWDPPDHWQMTPRQILRDLPTTARILGRRLPLALRGLAVIEKAHPVEPHWYLAVLGTRTSAQGHGVGSALITPILDRCDAEGVPAYLESSKEANLPFYRRHGFIEREPLILPKGPPIWPMWREPR